RGDRLDRVVARAQGKGYAHSVRPLSRARRHRRARVGARGGGGVARPLPGVIAIGLTGGIGSGKSTVAARLGALGASVVDTDEISRALTAAGGDAVPLLRAALGDRFVAADGALDRAAVRRFVFEDPAARARLESILHPAIRE